MSWLSKAWNAVSAYFNLNPTPSESERLQTAARAMDEQLGLNQELTAFTMTRAEEAYDKLQSELENNEALQRQAEEFARDDNMDMAQRCVVLRLQSDEQIKKLQAEYQQLRQQAEAKVQSFQDQRKEVQRRREQLPQLTHDARMLEREEQLQKAVSPLNPQAPIRAFDDAQRELNIRRKTLQNQELLLSDPNKDLDRQIQQAIGQKRLGEAMTELQQKVKSPVIDAQFTDRALGPAEKAKQLPPPSWKVSGFGGGITGSKALPPGDKQ